MSFTITEGRFKLNGKKVFLNSGEIHYFRIKRNLWDKHLAAARDAGLTTVSSYIPWAWHEPRKGFFDFNGKSCPERDLVGWLEACHSHGLHAIVKPGPFILAETRGAGLPEWFLDEFGAEVKMLNRRGEAVASDGVSLFNEQYLHHVGLWYDQIMPLIGKSEVAAGGPVIMMQICNEIGVFSWLAHQGDYGGGVRSRFIDFLRSRYESITELNRQWGTLYADFENVELPPDGQQPYASKEDRSRDYQWHCFWRVYYADYLKLLTAMARERGVTVPLYHNLPGWIYGSGYEFPVNITMYDELFGQKSDILFGVDHIPEYVSYRNMHDDRIINDIASAMQGNKPLFAAEFQCGSREFHVVTNNRELELFYKSSLANGLMGWNYYMFSQGRNPRQRGYSGETFYWFNPLTPEGERTEAFDLVGRMSRLLKNAESILLEARRKAEVCVLFYPPYYATELERPETGASGLLFNASSIRRPAYFDGLLKALQILNVDYDMADLSKESADNLSKYKQVWAFATDEMNGAEQQVLVDFTRNGGHLVIFPALPDRDMSQSSCTILRDALGVEPVGYETIDSPLVDIMGHQDIKCANPQVIFSEESLENAEIIARTISGNICGFSKRTGRGRVIHLGTWLGFDTEGHLPVYESILNLSGACLRSTQPENFWISTRQRFTERGTALLFIGNFYNQEHTGKINYTHPVSGEHIAVPLGDREAVWPPLYGVISPIGLEILPGLFMLHSTSDLLQLEVSSGQIKLVLYGDRDLVGEVVLEGHQIDSITGASLDGEELPVNTRGGRIILGYTHKHMHEMVLNLKLK